MYKFIFLGLTVWLLVRSSDALAQADPSADTVSSLVAGVLARERAVISGRFVYRRTTISRRVEGERTETGEPVHFTFMGESWTLRQRISGSLDDKMASFRDLEAEMVSVNHKGSLVNYNVTKYGKDQNKVSSYSTLENAKAVNEANETPPYFAGTIWHKTTVAYIQRNGDKARLSGTGEVDDVTVDVLEWDVAGADDCDAFYAVNDLLEDGGILRLYVAPDLGYALPKIEHVGRSGEVHAVYRSRDFRRVADGVYFPQETSRQTRGVDSRKGFTWKYTFELIEDVNEPIDEKEFIIELPQGTQVADIRKPGQRGVIIRRSAESDMLPTRLPELAGTQHVGSPSRWRIWLLAVNVVVFLSVLAWFGWRRWKLRAS